MKVECQITKNRGVISMNIKGFGKANKEMISIFEQYIGFLLPEDYKQFLSEYNGGITPKGYELFFVNELNETIPLNVLYGLGTEKRELNLKFWFDEYKDDLLSNCIIIGDDPGSGMIVLINDSELKGIYYWDHSFYFDQSNEDQNIYKIAEPEI